MTRTYTLLDIWQQVIEDNVSVDMSYGNKQADALNKSIKKEINSRNNKKHYKSMKVRRGELINKYSKISKIK